MKIQCVKFGEGDGLNAKSLLNSLSLGFPDTVDQMWQEKGRVGRDPDSSVRGVVFYQPSDLLNAVSVQRRTRCPP
jgi:ATP-dependent helicase YprA (DUF1998 family)